MGNYDSEPVEVKADLEVVADLATKAAELRPVALTGEAPQVPLGILIPEGSELRILEADRFTEYPGRKTGRVCLATADALVAYTTRHLTDGTELYVHPTSGKVVAVLDDHAEGHAGHGGHRAELQLQRTPEWDTWIGHDGKLLPQAEFAEHFEDNGHEVVRPSAAKMLEVATTFRAVQKAAFRQATHLQSGDLQVNYEETTAARAGQKGQLAIPTEFTLGIAPFVGGPKYEVVARLRYRLNDGDLRLGYKLVRPDAVVRDALNAVADELREQFTNVFIGESR